MACRGSRFSCCAARATPVLSLGSTLDARSATKSPNAAHPAALTCALRRKKDIQKVEKRVSTSKYFQTVLN
jgi:hypothetical protein